MREEFYFKFDKGNALLNLQEFERVMDARMSNMVQSDFRQMDQTMVAIFDQKISTAKNPTRGFLGRMGALAALQKFR